MTSIIIDTGVDGTFSETALATTDYELIPRNAGKGPEPEPYTGIELTPYGTVYAWPVRARIQVTGIWGWPSVPEGIKRACVQLTGILRMESPRSTNQFTDLGNIMGSSRAAQDILNNLTRDFRKITF